MKKLLAKRQFDLTRRKTFIITKSNINSWVTLKHWIAQLGPVCSIGLQKPMLSCSSLAEKIALWNMLVAWKRPLAHRIVWRTEYCCIPNIPALWVPIGDLSPHGPPLEPFKTGELLQLSTPIDAIALLRDGATSTHLGKKSRFYSPTSGVRGNYAAELVHIPIKTCCFLCSKNSFLCLGV